MRGREAGQATVEWVGLVLFVALVFAVGALSLPKLAGWRLGAAVLHGLVCAVRGGCDDGDGSLEQAYGAELAAAVREHAPQIVYERRSAELPIDFRSCRSVDCSNGSDAPAEIDRSTAGLPVTAFTRVVDHRARGGNAYIQYWFYYPKSFSGGIGRALGDRWPGEHPDDWEGYQVRIAPNGTASARATAHGGYKNFKNSEGWGPYTGWYRVSGGSHAGHLVEGPTGERTTSKANVTLISLERLRDTDLYSFDVSPPWRKAAYTDPESPSS